MSGLKVGLYYVVIEGQLFALLIEDIVVVGVGERVYAVFSGGNAFDDKLAAAVGSRHSEHGLACEYAVAQVAVEAYEDAFNGLEVLRVEHVSCHFERVDVVACRESVGVVAQRVALVVVADGVGEVDGVGGVGLERVFNLHHDALSGGLDFGRLDLRRRYDDLLGGVVHLDIFVEVDAYLARLDVYALVGGRASGYSRRRLVIPSAVGLSHPGARRDYHGGHERQQGQCAFLQACCSVACFGGVCAAVCGAAPSAVALCVSVHRLRC